MISETYPRLPGYPFQLAENGSRSGCRRRFRSSFEFPKAIEPGLQRLRRAGTLAVAGMPPAGVTAQIEPLILADKGQHIVGSKMGSTRLGVDVPKLVRLYQEGRLKLDELITARYPLAEINEAIAAVKRGEALRNVILF